MRDASQQSTNGGDLPRLSILALAPNEWDGPWLNRQQLLSRLGRRHHIVYSSGPRSQAGSRYWRPVKRATHNVTVEMLPRWLARSIRMPGIGPLAVRFLARRWEALAAVQRPFVVWCFHPKFWPYVRHMRQRNALIYHAYDLYHRQGHWDAERDGYEKELVANADLVIASSPEIAEHLKTRVDRGVFVLENAADFEAFAIDPEGTPQPDDLMHIPKPRIGYVGALNRKVDFPLILWLALRNPQWHFVFVGELGNLDAVTSPAVERLRLLSNVHFVGFKSPHELPQYVARMDVNLMAYRLSDTLWSHGIYPLKLHEYLASGRPVVSADLPSVRPFSRVVLVARSEREWEESIRLSLSDTTAASASARRVVARQNDWQVRVEALETRLIELLASTNLSDVRRARRP